jgi:triphosphatase
MNGPFETELKFQIPARSLAAVKQAIATKTARTVALQARYFDTPDQRLATQRVALRMRREGAQWVQTVKALGPNAMVRLEHEVRLDSSEDKPPLDTARHAGTDAGNALAAALGDRAGSSQLVFETRVLRTLRLVRHAGALVEVALDVGDVIAGERQQPLCELEFELKRGPIDGLLSLAARWVKQHGLWLDVRSKAERGLRLARATGAGSSAQSDRPALTPDMSGDAALRAMVGACLAQILQAAAAVADGAKEAEHLHQLRVGLRRLRCVLRVFGDGSSAADPNWGPALAKLFNRLGSTRDRNVFALTVFPALRAAGAPLAELPPDACDDDPGKAVRGFACTELLLKLLGFVHGAATRAPGDGDAEAPRLLSLLQPRLRRLRRQLRTDADRFLDLDDTLRHRCRKRLKRWRYSLEFAAPLYTAKAMKRNLARVREAQEILGRYNDLSTAEQAFLALAPHDARAWFAVGWLKAERERLVRSARKALVKVIAAADELRSMKKGSPARRSDDSEP